MIVDFLKDAVNEGFFGVNLGASPAFNASYEVQGSNDTYSYNIHAFNDTLQQKPNEVDNRY